MTLVATKFTPEVLLSAPRRTAAIPNREGTLALYTETSYSFDSHSKSFAFKVLDIKTGNSTTLYDAEGYTDPAWVSDTEFVFVQSGDKGSSLMMADATKERSKPHEICSFKGAISNLKAKKISDDTVAIACSALATPSGEMYSAADEPKPHSSAKVYTKLFVRHWDTWVTENTSAIWYGALKKDGGRYSLQEPGLVNALAGTKLESPVPPFGGSSDFDISNEGLVFISNHPEVNAAIWTRTDVYYVPLKTFTEAEPPLPQIIKTGNLQGYSGTPVFSHDGKRLVFKRMRHQQYESDKPRLLLIPDIKDLSNVQEFYKTDDGEGGWDLRPDAIVWSNNDSELFVTAEKEGRSLLFRLPSSPLEAKSLPEPFTHDGAVGDVFNLAHNGRLFITSSSLIDSSAYSVVDPDSKDITLVSSSSKQGKSFGLSKSQISEFWFHGAGDYKCHALVMKPSDFDSSKKYPLAMLIHGGPQGAWTESWSTRWNPAIFAEQGYVVVLPNPTGSTGYGQELTDGIAREWGGRPYNDLVNCFDHITSELPYVDTTNAVALGASYGGYMINWIQGHPLGRRFKALVCHDGVFSTMNDWATEELFFTVHDMGGTLWESRELYEKWDPAAFTSAWATPQLVIHSELDYRLPITEGLAAFNVLQAREVPSKFLMFPDENHWVLKPENSLVWHKEVLGWINKYTSLDRSGLAGETDKLSL
ncbi:prolyl oligopeptidase [Pseudomassariella vexata]|uniref:Dipeptidyl-peptidase V n=1 Tax=Pseudomassariella vexata TaxID=1141098 RepID=A0A1Y2DSP3_9PEZI|nr:prolyl oligopeptidase [Pseudomassariella vexata]ORY62146.1 prolyl oligopeptidase [Pseudomassariella vexata]